MLISKDREDFKIWLDNFAKKYNSGNEKSYIPEDKDDFLDTWEKNHENIHSILGGTSKTIEIESPIDPLPIAISHIEEITNPIFNLLPDYYNKYKLNICHLQYPSLPTHKNISTTKHICGHASRSKLDDKSKKIVQDCTAKLGELYKRNTLPNKKTKITITTHPKAFAMLGLFHFEKGTYSCFRQGKFNSDKKYTLCNGIDSFILLGHDNFDLGKLDDENKNLISRSVGTIKDGTFNTFNSRGTPFENNGVIKTFAEKILEYKNSKVLNNKVYLQGGINYIGSYITSVSQKDMNNEPMKIEFSIKYSKEFHQPKYKTKQLENEGWVDSRDSYANWK